MCLSNKNKYEDVFWIFYFHLISSTLSLSKFTNASNIFEIDIYSRNVASVLNKPKAFLQFPYYQDIACFYEVQLIRKIDKSSRAP